MTFPHSLSSLEETGFPIRWPPSYAALASRLGPDNPLLRMGLPHAAEASPDPDALADPTRDLALRPVPHLVRKHPDRAVILATSRCFFHCRFCFRRGEREGRRANDPTRRQWEAILTWLSRHPEVEEVILSGGDPLTLEDQHLARVREGLEGIPHVTRWRIHTRAPVVESARVDGGLLRALSGSLPLRVVLHLNHPAELTPAVLGAVRRLDRAGFEVLSQSVLLAGVNADPEVLLQLLRRLAGAGIRPHYLHHPDRARGNRRFRLTLAAGREIYRELLERVQRGRSPLPCPPYVVDLPNGAGKVPVADPVPVAEERAGALRRTRYRWVRPQGWDAVVPDRSWEWWDIWDQRNDSPTSPHRW